MKNHIVIIFYLFLSVFILVFLFTSLIHGFNTEQAKFALGGALIVTLIYIAFRIIIYLFLKIPNLVSSLAEEKGYDGEAAFWEAFCLQLFFGLFASILLVYYGHLPNKKLN